MSKRLIRRLRPNHLFLLLSSFSSRDRLYNAAQIASKYNIVMADRARFIPVMECLAVSKLPEGPQWVYEIKLDGYRAGAIRSSG